MYFKNGIHYRTFKKDGVEFYFFKNNGEKVLCTGNPTGTTTLVMVTDVGPIYSADGTTSEVSGCGSLSCLYYKWLSLTFSERVEADLTF